MEIINLFIKCRESKQNYFNVYLKNHHISVISRLNFAKKMCCSGTRRNFSLKIYLILFLVRSLIYGQNNMQTWGLIVLLVSKMGGHDARVIEQEKSDGVLISQRTLAEVVEMVRTANMIHSSGVLNLQHLQQSGNDLSFDSDLIFGNKIALLGGDILLGNASAQMAQLK